MNAAPTPIYDATVAATGIDPVPAPARRLVPPVDLSAPTQIIPIVAEEAHTR